MKIKQSRQTKSKFSTFRIFSPSVCVRITSGEVSVGQCKSMLAGEYENSRACSSTGAVSQQRKLSRARDLRRYGTLAVESTNEMVSRKFVYFWRSITGRTSHCRGGVGWVRMFSTKKTFGDVTAPRSTKITNGSRRNKYIFYIKTH